MCSSSTFIYFYILKKYIQIYNLNNWPVCISVWFGCIMAVRSSASLFHMAHPQIVDELRDQILKLRFPHRVQNIKEVTPKTKRKLPGQPSPSKSPSLPVPKLALSDRPCVVVLNKPLERLLIRWLRGVEAWSRSVEQQNTRG